MRDNVPVVNIPVDRPFQVNLYGPRELIEEHLKAGKVTIEVKNLEEADWPRPRNNERL